MYVVSPSEREKNEALKWIFSREDDLGTWEELKAAIQRGPAEEIEEIERQIEGDRR